MRVVTVPWTLPIRTGSRSLVEDRLRGTAYGVKHAVNGMGDLVSSLKEV